MYGRGTLILALLQFLIWPSLESGTHHNQGQGRTSNAAALKLLDKMLRNYDRRSTPTNDMGIATNVSVELHVASLGSINTENMDYVTDAYLRQRWRDPRMKHENMTESLDLADPALVKAIWKPEVFFPNAKEAHFQFVTVPNVLVRIQPTGEILYILRLRLKFSCMMELSRYPLDRQICGMQIASFSKTTRELQLYWSQNENPVSISSDLKMPQFTIEKVSSTTCNEQFHLGNYSCLVAQFYMKRSISFHLIQSYLPSILIVAISWVSFWMDLDSVPGRISLGVITMLAVSGQAGVDKNVPQTSYVKAIDVWMGLCTAFVFSALVEFTIVNFWFRKQRHPAHMISNIERCSTNPTSKADHYKSEQNHVYGMSQNEHCNEKLKNSNYLCSYHQKQLRQVSPLNCQQSEEETNFSKDERFASKHQNEPLPLVNRRNKDMNHVTNNGNHCGYVKNAKPSTQLATMSCGEEEGCYTHPKDIKLCSERDFNVTVSAMGSGRESETANNHFCHPTGLSLSSMKKDDDRCKRNHKNDSIVKSLSSYSTCTEGEKYFTSPKGHHYFYTRTGNKHLLVPTENVLKDDVPCGMTRSHTCHDNPLFLSDDNTLFSNLATKENEPSPRVQDNHSSNNLNYKLNKTHKSNSTVKENKGELNRETRDEYDPMARRLNCNYSSYKPPRSRALDEKRCSLCVLSEQNKNNERSYPRFSASVIPSGDGVFRTVLRGPPGHFQKENTYINYIDETNEYLFDANDSNISEPNDNVTYAHPAELVDQACRGLFPLGFFICNCVYWVYYLYIAEDLSTRKYPH